MLRGGSGAEPTSKSAWIKSLVSGILDAAEREATQQGHSLAPDTEFKRWLDWARRYAEEIDPLTISSST
jgi:hypothetical protein